MGKAPFEGLRVLDFTHEWAGPVGARILGDYGAEVIRVEYSKRMCVVRGARLDDKMYNKHPRWFQVNRNKRSVTLDLNLPDDMEIFKDLVRISDIVLNNSRTGVMEKLGISYEQLKAIREDIVLVVMPAYGATGPYAKYGGFGGAIEPLSGLQQLTAYEKDGKRLRVREMDVSNALMGACAIMTALVGRQRTGRGQFVDMSQMESATHSLMGEHLLEYVMNGKQTLPLGNRHRHYAPQGCYRCKGDDRWVTIVTRSQMEWQGLCEALGVPELFVDPRFKTREARRANHDELDRIIEGWTATRGHVEAMDILQARGVPAGAVMDGNDLSKDRHLNERNYFMPAEDKTEGLYPGMIAGLSEGAGRIRRRGPDLGADNEYVICELLGRPRDRLKPLRDEDINTSYESE